MKSLNNLYSDELRAMLERADIDADHLAVFTEFLPTTFDRFQNERIPTALAFLEMLAEACNHEVELRFEPRINFEGSLIELLQIAYAQSWKAYKKTDGHTRFVGPNGRTKAVVLEKGNDIVEIYLTPHGRRVINAFRKNGGADYPSFGISILD